MKQQLTLRPFLLAILISSLFFWGCSQNSVTFQVRFSEVSGLRQYDHVYFQGNEIGKVNKVTYTTQGDYLVEVEIAPAFTNAATEDSKFYIEHAPASETAMAVIVEQERSGGVLLKNGTIVQGSMRPGYFDKFINDLKKTADKAEDELNKALEDLKKSLDASSQRLDRDLEAAIDDLSQRLDSFREELGKMPDSQEVQQLEESVRRFVNEFQKAQKNVQDHIRDEVLPQLQMELEQLREQLRKEGREKEMEQINKQIKELDMV